MKVLVITDRIPYPISSGGPLRIYNLVLRVAQHHEVWLAALSETPGQDEGTSHMQGLCCGVEVAVRSPRHPVAHLPGLVQYALQGKPLELKFGHSDELVSKVQGLSAAIDFDIVQIEYSHMAPYIEALPPKRRAKRILMFHDVAFSKFERIARYETSRLRKVRPWLHSAMMHRWEPRYAARFDRCATVSDADAALLTTANPRLRVDVVPNGVDTRAYQPLPEEAGPPSLLFVGNMGYTPCVDAALYFHGEILPLVRERVPEVQLWIVGTNPAPEVRQLEGEGVHVTGRVADVVPYYAQSTACVVPLRAGGGTRLKILEAMALGRPVVSTTIGCEGLGVTDGRDISIADSPGQFARKTVDLLTDRVLREQITTNARHLVADRYDWDDVAEHLMGIYADLLNE